MPQTAASHGAAHSAQPLQDQTPPVATLTLPSIVHLGLPFPGFFQKSAMDLGPAEGRCFGLLLVTFFVGARGLRVLCLPASLRRRREHEQDQQPHDDRRKSGDKVCLTRPERVHEETARGVG